MSVVMEIADPPAAEPAAPESFTAADLMHVLVEACIKLDPANATAYRYMTAEHVREAVRVSTHLLDHHREYQRRYRITRRGRRDHAAAVYRLLDVAPPPFTVVAAAWALLPTALLNADTPEGRSPLRDAAVGILVE